MEKGRKNKKSCHIMRILKPYLLIAPAILGIMLFTVYPAIKMVFWSFYDVNQLNPAKTKFVGMKNYVKIFHSTDFVKSLKNTGIYTLWTVVFIMLCAVVLAIWLGRKKDKFSKFTQAAMFLPHIISMISVGLIFAQMMGVNNGLLNEILVAVGLERCQWTQSSSTALMSVILVAVWKAIGYYTVIIMGSLQSIPDSICEAAALDDASKLTTLRKITIPLISPQLFFTLIIMTIGSFKVFETIRVMTAGGPNNSTNSLVYYVYQQVFTKYDIGRAAAGGTVLFIIVGILTILYFALLSKKVHYQ